MFSKLILLSFASLALSAPQHQQAAQYPAGVNPADCPNFPICDNARLHNPQAHWNPQPAASWQQPAASWQQPAPSWQQPTTHAWQPAPAAPAWQPQNHWGAPAQATAGGDKYPAGVNPHTCPNYPFCDVNAGHAAAPVAPPLPGWNERLYPAGVSPHQCPNFPYCH